MIVCKNCGHEEHEHPFRHPFDGVEKPGPSTKPVDPRWRDLALDAIAELELLPKYYMNNPCKVERLRVEANKLEEK